FIVQAYAALLPATAAIRIAFRAVPGESETHDGYRRGDRAGAESRFVAWRARRSARKGPGQGARHWAVPLDVGVEISGNGAQLKADHFEREPDERRCRADLRMRAAIDAKQFQRPVISGLFHL